MCMISKWLERNRIWLLCGSSCWKNLDIDEPTSFLDHMYLGCTQRVCKPNERIIEQKTKMFALIFLLEQQNITWSGSNLTHKQWRRPYDMEGTCSKMRRAILWVGERESRATLQNFASSLWWSSIQTGGTWISWRIARSMLANCLEMLAFGKNWTTWYSMVSQQACKISHKMDWGMWQTLSWADFLHSSHEWLSSILSCGKHGTALQTRLVSRFRLC